ncbi:Zinc finger protein 75A [Collichthys lucidus]|uniref:Zinc finger protein 75A n=1 Tax=Collichthys lucidus TaxID=240159 RepID=A0A4U5VUU9_COLLU|nr:Zinc finger protein 75A [Collichthys lucidus]
MSTVQALRAFVSQRLAVAVEDIIDMFQRTITEYERELDRQRRLLGAEQPPGVKLTVNGETGVSQDIRSLIIGAKIPTEQQDLNCRLDQEALCIKEEPEELVQTGSVWMRQGMEGADIISQFTLVSVKTEDDEENPQSSQLQQRQTEKQLEADAAQQIEAGAVRESCGGSEPAFDLDVAGFLKATSDGQFFLSQCFKTGTEDLDYDWKQTECRPFPDTLKDDDSVSHQRSHNPKKLFKCPVCRETFKHSTALQRHMTCHTGERPFVCTVCGKTFRQKGSLHIHMRKHTGEKPFSCLVCGKNFTQSGTLSAHMRIHTGEKPFSCSVCKKRVPSRENNVPILVRMSDIGFFADNRYADIVQLSISDTDISRYRYMGYFLLKTNLDEPYCGLLTVVKQTDYQDNRRSESQTRSQVFFFLVLFSFTLPVLLVLGKTTPK